MGTLKGGETYLVTYNGGTSWTTEGYDENQGRKVALTFLGGKKEWHQFNMWGRSYIFSSHGEVFDYTWGLVGHIYCCP